MESERGHFFFHLHHYADRQTDRRTWLRRPSDSKPVWKTVKRTKHTYPNLDRASCSRLRNTTARNALNCPPKIRNNIRHGRSEPVLVCMYVCKWLRLFQYGSCVNLWVYYCMFGNVPFAEFGRWPLFRKFGLVRFWLIRLRCCYECMKVWCISNHH